MPHLEVIHHRPPSRMARLAQVLRSYTLGPLSLKDPEISRKLGWGGGPTAAGVSVSESTALNYAAVWQAVSLIAGDVGSLPLLFYKRTKGGGKERYTDHPTYELLRTAPNPEMSAMTFRQVLQAHLLTWGNAYSEIERDGAGRPVALWPMLPSHVRPFRTPQKQLRYTVHSDSGPDIEFRPDEVLHIPGLGFDGTLGYSPIRQARESLGLLAATEKFGATFFGNGTSFGGALKHPKVMGTPAQNTLRDSINALHRGPDRAHRFLILEEGMEFARFGVDPNDAQFLETRTFQIHEVARWFNLPLHKLREMKDSSVRANIEQEALDYVTSTLRPWLTAWEQEINRKLVSPRERHIQYAEFLVEGLLRGDLKSRYDAYAVGRNWGWLSVNEIRSFENMNPVDGGDTYLSPSNMVPADRLDEIVDKQVAPTPAPVAPVPAAPMMSESGDPDARFASLVSQVATQALTIGQLQQQVEGLEVARAAFEADAVRLAGELGAAASREQTLRSDVERLTSAVDLLEIRALAAERALEARNVEILAASIRVDALESERDALRAEIATSASKSLEADSIAEAKRQALTAELEVARLAAVAAEAERAKADERVSALAVEHAAALRTVMSALEASTDDVRAATELAEATQAELDTTRAALAERNTEVVSANTEAVAAVDAQHVAEIARGEAEAAKVTAEQAAERAVATSAAAVLAAQEAEQTATAAQAESAATRTAYADRLTGLITAQRAVILASLQRLVTREMERARAKRATQEKLTKWIGDYYEAHEADLWVDALRAPVGVHRLLIGADLSDEAVATVVAAHFEESKRQLLAVAASAPEDYGAALDATFYRWESERATKLADAFVREEIAYVRSIQ